MSSFNSPATTISKLMAFVMALHFLFDSKNGVYGQSVNITSTGNITDCSKDLRAGVDKYTIVGKVDGNVNMISPLVNFEIKRGSSNFTILCPVFLTNCGPPNGQLCYCAANTSNVFEIVANRTAIVSDSNANVRIQWASGTNSVTSVETLLPTILDVNSVTTSISVNEEVLAFPANITYSSIIKFKCLNSPSPCKIILYLDNNFVDHKDMEITYTVPSSLPSNTSHELVFSFSICGGSTSNITCTFGIVTKLPQCSLDCEDWAIALSVIFYAAILVIICSGIAILIPSLKKDKKKVILYLSIGFLIFSEVLDIILIIVFAQAGPCKCDLELELWKIMLIIFCIVNGLLIIAAVAELIWTSVSGTGSNKVEKEEAETDSTSPNANTLSITTTNKPNKRTAKCDEKKRGQHTNSVSNRNKDKEKTEYSTTMSEAKNAETSFSKSPVEPKIDETNTQAINNVPVTKIKKKSKKKRNREQKKENSSTNQTLSETQAKNIQVLYS